MIQAASAGEVYGRDRLLLGSVVDVLPILMGIATLMSLTGSLTISANSPAELPTFRPGVFLFSALQILAFLAGTISLITYAWTAMRRSSPSLQVKPMQSVSHDEL